MLKRKRIDPNLAKRMETGNPVPGFPVKFSWHEYYWKEIFDKQVELIREDIRRARAEDHLIVYLSCPISARGGGDQSTNIDIAKNTERHLLETWGEGFWFLNPAQYQLESKEGTGLMEKHAQSLGYDLAELRAATPGGPGGGDYMRMWTRVLVEDQGVFNFKDPDGRNAALKNTGQHFDGFYFLGPSDALRFFTKSGGQTITASVEAHFARKFATDADFRDRFTIPTIDWRDGWSTDPSSTPEQKNEQQTLRCQWEELRRNYLRFYSLRASIAYSLGSHDEWQIFRQINASRRKALASTSGNLGIAGQLAGFFDGSAIDPAAGETEISRGYSK